MADFSGGPWNASCADLAVRPSPGPAFLSRRQRPPSLSGRQRIPQPDCLLQRLLLAGYSLNPGSGGTLLVSVNVGDKIASVQRMVVVCTHVWTLYACTPVCTCHVHISVHRHGCLGLQNFCRQGQGEVQAGFPQGIPTSQCLHTFGASRQARCPLTWLLYLLTLSLTASNGLSSEWPRRAYSAFGVCTAVF